MLQPRSTHIQRLGAPQVLHLPPVFDLQRQLRPKAAPRGGGGPQPPPNSPHAPPTPASLRAADPRPRLQRMSAPASLQQEDADAEADPEQSLGAARGHGAQQAPDALDAARRLAAESLHPSLMHAMSEPPGGPGDTMHTDFFHARSRQKVNIMHANLLTCILDNKS